MTDQKAQGPTPILRLGWNDEILDAHGRRLALIEFRDVENHFFASEAEARASARAIVERYNLHSTLTEQNAKLVAAVERGLSQLRLAGITDGSAVEAMSAALKSARGEAP